MTTKKWIPQKKLKVLCLLFTISGMTLGESMSQNPLTNKEDILPHIPVGYDAYRSWEQLPLHKIGIRAYMRSTCDRSGNSVTFRGKNFDVSHFLYQESDTFNVTMDVKGQGILYFMRFNHWHGSPWHFEIDGKNHIVKETATLDPIDAKNKYEHVHIIPEKPFPKPMTYTWETTKGADLFWTPMGFQDRLRLAYTRTFYGTGYYIYHQIPYGTKNISQNVESWSLQEPPQDVISFLNKAGTDLYRDDPKKKSIKKKISLKPHETLTLMDIGNGPSSIVAIKIKIPKEKSFEFGQSRLRITWDNNWHPSVDAPLAMFYGAGELYNGEDKEYLVKGLPLSVRYHSDYIYLNCYWPMPFKERALIELQERNGNSFEDIEFEFYTKDFEYPLHHMNYFHATYTDNKTPALGESTVYLDTKFVEGGGDWSGHFVGMTWIFTRTGNKAVLEGDPRFFFDDSKTPQAMGTGSEEWGGGGDFWGGETMSLPLAGHPIGKFREKARNEKDLINSAYRFLIADYFPFGKRALITIENGQVNSMQEPCSGVTYWYGINKASLILTDELNVCHPIDRERHNYSSPHAEPCYAFLSRFEIGPDTDPDSPVNPHHRKDDFYSSRAYHLPQEDSVHATTGTTQFTVKLVENNHGVLLRRKLDYTYPNQEARVYVREKGKEKWNYVGNWYTAGSKTHVFSRPEGKSYTEAELGPTEHVVLESRHAWKEDEFSIAAAYTRGIEQMEIKLEFVPNEIELHPGYPFPAPSRWSESRYKVYSWILPVD